MGKFARLTVVVRFSGRGNARAKKRKTPIPQGMGAEKD
jgi:hypothetical protein